MLPIKTILHPTDFSPSSKHAFQLACLLARDHYGRLILLHVEKTPEIVAGEFGVLPQVQVDLAAARSKLDALSVPIPLVVERRVTQGEPAQEILKTAAESECDLIVMGTHGHSMLHDLLMGSVAAEIVREAPCAVLTLKADKGGRQTVGAMR